MTTPLAELKRIGISNALRSCQLFAGISPSDLTAIAEITTTKSVAKGSYLLPMTKRVLAAELGTVSETFSRTLAKFREQNLLTVAGKTVTVLCPARLTALLRRNLGE